MCAPGIISLIDGRRGRMGALSKRHSALSLLPSGRRSGQDHAHQLCICSAGACARTWLWWIDVLVAFARRSNSRCSLTRCVCISAGVAPTCMTRIRQ
jgi:hypothetical protein